MLLLLAVGMSFPVTARAAQDFIVGFDAEFPPYGYMDNGEYVGFDLDLAQGVCQRRGWNLIKRPINWDAKDAELSSGTISCIWNGFTMNGRENDYTWSEAYVDNSQVVLVKKGSSIHSLSDLAGKILVVQTDSSALAALTGEDATEENKKLRASLGELQQVKDYNTAIMNLESGMVDAIALDIGVANYQLEGKEDKLEMLSERLSSENYGIGFKKGNTKLRDEVQTTLNEMVEDGTFAQIAAKWKLTDSVCLKPSGAESASAAAVTATGSGVSETTGGSGSSTSIWKTIGQLGELYVDFVILTATGITALCSQNVPFPYFAVDCQDLYIHHERNTVDAAAFGCAVCTILCVWNPTFLFLSFLCGDYWILTELCSVLCRNLPLRFPGNPGGTERSSYIAWIWKKTYLFPHPFPTDGEESAAAGYQ